MTRKQWFITVTTVALLAIWSLRVGGVSYVERYVQWTGQTALDIARTVK